MTKYLLLRNNKETGPFQLEELLAHGLKPYDLVWVEGKSAAWRYPGEINELKPYAPMVEEQPFDRFYKKPAAEKQEPEITQSTTAAAKQSDPGEAYSSYLPKTTEKASQASPSKKVFVKLPGQADFKKIPEKKKETPPIVPVYTSPVQVQEQQEYLHAYQKQPATLNDMQENYARKLEDRKQRLARKSFAQSFLRKAVAVAGLIGVGILVGFIMRPGADKKQPVAEIAGEQQAQTNPTGAENLSVINEPITSVANDDANISLPPASPDRDAEKNQAQTEVRLDKKTAEKLSNPQPLTEKQLATLKITKENMVASPEMERTVEEKYAYTGSETNKSTGERSKAVRNEQSEMSVLPRDNEQAATTRKESVREGKSNNSWAQLISLTSNEYKKVPLGGIRSLELTVTNKSASPIEQVIVELQYLRSNDQPVKTENVTFRSIPAKESVTVRVPDTNRGVKIAYRVLRVDNKSGDGLVNR